jgi:hypothetical protein
MQAFPPLSLQTPPLQTHPPAAHIIHFQPQPLAGPPLILSIFKLR